jgi:cytoskeletal protein RodZ
MTRTDVMASSRPRTVGATSIDRRSRVRRRGLLTVPIALVLAGALALPGAASAAEGTSSYGSTPTTPTTTKPTTTPTTTTPTTTTPTTTTPEPKTGTSPSKESATTPTETTPKSTAPSTAKETSLPFTGLDLRWIVGIGFLFMGAGVSMLMMQRRQRRGGR